MTGAITHPPRGLDHQVFVMQEHQVHIEQGRQFMRRIAWQIVL